MSAVPDLREELDRKSMETIEFLYTGLDNGKLTLPQFSTGLDTLFMAVAGLVDKEIVDFVSNGSLIVANAPDQFCAKRAFLNPVQTVALCRKLGGDTFTVDVYQGGHLVKQERKEYLLAKQATDAMNTLAGRLLAAGYIEI
jgi:hypothetical protein